MNDSYGSAPDRSKFGENFELELITYKGVRTIMVWHLLSGRHEIYCSPNGERKILYSTDSKQDAEENFFDLLAYYNR